MRFFYLIFVILDIFFCKNSQSANILRFSNGLHPIYFDVSRDSPLDPISRKPMVSSMDCASCHQQIFKNWNQSMHRQSFTNRIYQDSHKDEPLEWCLNCHAPLKTTSNVMEEKRFLEEEGVSCITCHVRNQKILTSKKKEGNSLTHSYTVVTVMNQEEFCGNCHQFNWPTRKSFINTNKNIVYSDIPMQNTLGEYKISKLKKTRNCQSCHLFRNSLKSHTFPGGHNKTYLEDSFFVTLERASQDNFKLIIKTNEIAHSFPTGDLFRSMRIRILTPKEYLIKEWILNKEFIPNEDNLDKPPKILVADTSFPPPNENGESIKEFLFRYSHNETELKFELYMDYLNATSHLHGSVPLSDSLLLFKKGELTIPPISPNKG
ncbi:multiheme c-type cytochrome [Leptospira sp. 96542]|nr:multiheme c-type cytochrome [Leptospira sp. 96542]